MEEVSIESNSKAIGTCSPLTGTTANDGSRDVSSYNINNEDTCNRDYTAAECETNNEPVKMRLMQIKLAMVVLLMLKVMVMNVFFFLRWNEGSGA